MPWPTMADYQEAIQFPRTCFADPELQQGVPLLTPLGLPWPITGAFASVYQLACGRKQYAVRCFLRYHPDQAQRYAAISHALRRAALPFMVNFTLLDQGIRVRGQWYPILKMEWLNGLPLHSYIEQNLTQPARLRDLAARFQQVMARLQQAGIAHGDLQHGNLLIVNHDIRLIDYDGMYVPDLRGLQSHELGHRNYQHPRRAEADFGPYVDHFSAWTIYASLKALSAQPGLWRELDGGDESLLLRRDDFVRPESSLALRRLSAAPDAEVRALAETIRSAALGSVQAVPPFGGGARRTVGSWLPLRPARDDPDETAVAGAGQRAATSRPATYQGADWVLDYLPSAEPTLTHAEQDTRIIEGAAQIVERYVISGGALLAYLLLPAASLGLLSAASALLLALAIIGLVTAFLAARYSLFPEVRAKRRLLTQQMKLHAEMMLLDRRVQRFVGERGRLRLDEATRLASLDREIEAAIHAELERVPLHWREIPGLPGRLGVRLRWFGVRTAADVVERRLLRVNGLSQVQINSLLAWRTGLEQRVWRDHARALQGWYNQRAADIRRESAQQRHALAAEESAVRRAFDHRRNQLDRLTQSLRQYDHVTFTTYLRWVF